MREKPDVRWLPLLPPDDSAAARSFKVRTKVWRHKSGSWYLANVPPRPSAQIKAQFGSTAKGWGSIRVHLKIGKTEWDTSLFPDRTSKTYVFAIKAAVRKAEGLSHGTAITVHVRIA